MFDKKSHKKGWTDLDDFFSHREMVIWNSTLVLRRKNILFPQDSPKTFIMQIMIYVCM